MGGNWHLELKKHLSTNYTKDTNNDALAKSVCHARMFLSGIHDFNELEPGFPLRISAGMTAKREVAKESTMTGLKFSFRDISCF